MSELSSASFARPLWTAILVVLLLAIAAPLAELTCPVALVHTGIVAVLLVAITLVFVYVLVQRRKNPGSWAAFVTRPQSRTAINLLAFSMALGIGMSALASNIGRDDVQLWFLILLPTGLTVMHTFFFTRFLLRLPKNQTIEHDISIKEDDEEWHEA